ncbi:MAG TPA: EAL domain-containing protein [Candidatus Acidoferrales bacterium]|nr:EAL domain-containing protein [Candidatus Acidoferrales bacterium]
MALDARISIDDFGTGYSSLSYLRRLPIDTLKIAKPFVDVVTHGAKDEALTKAIVALARSLQLEVVVEGIERQSQLDVLVRMGCELGQGFLVSPPVPARELPATAAATWGRPDVTLTALGWAISPKPGGPAHEFAWPSPGVSSTPVGQAKSG